MNIIVGVRGGRRSVRCETRHEMGRNRGRFEIGRGPFEFRAAQRDVSAQ